MNILSSMSVRAQGCLKMNGMVLVSDSTNVLYWGGALGRTIYAQTPHQITSVNLGVVYMIPNPLPSAKSCQFMN